MESFWDWLERFDEETREERAAREKDRASLRIFMTMSADLKGRGRQDPERRA